MLARLRRRLASRTDAGVTLIETIMSITILSIAGVAIMSGLALAVKSSDIHRKQATGGAYVRSYAEAIEKYLSTEGNYVGCAGADTYTPGVVGFSLPAGYTAQQAAAQPLAGDGTVISTGSCPTRDKGVQRLTLSVSSGDSRATERLTVVVRKACGTGTSCG